MGATAGQTDVLMPQEESNYGKYQIVSQ